MSRMFTIYGTAILMAFMTASYKGYALNSLFLSSHHSSASQNQYYHK